MNPHRLRDTSATPRLAVSAEMPIDAIFSSIPARIIQRLSPARAYGKDEPQTHPRHPPARSISRLDSGRTWAIRRDRLEVVEINHDEPRIGGLNGRRA